MAPSGGNTLALAVTPNYLYSVNGELQAAAPAQFAPQRMSVSEEHRVATGDAVKVAIIDTGIDADHSELSGSVRLSFDAPAPGPTRRRGTARRWRV